MCQSRIGLETIRDYGLVRPACESTQLKLEHDFNSYLAQFQLTSYGVVLRSVPDLNCLTPRYTPPATRQDRAEVPTVVDEDHFGDFIRAYIYASFFYDSA